MKLSLPNILFHYGLKFGDIFLKGSSVGIGAVTAVEFAKEGASVVLVGRNSGNLDKTAKQCQEAGLKQNQVGAQKAQFCQIYSNNI